jgi:hypothetical protein
MSAVSKNDVPAWSAAAIVAIAFAQLTGPYARPPSGHVPSPMTESPPSTCSRFPVTSANDSGANG